MTTATERTALARAEKAERRAIELQAALVSAESDVKRLQHELRVANGCLASVRAQRRAWRDECVEARKVVEAARRLIAGTYVVSGTTGWAMVAALAAFDAFVATRRTPASDSEAEETPPSRHEGG